MRVKVKTVLLVAWACLIVALCTELARSQTTINGARTVTSGLTVTGTTTTNGALTGTGAVTFEGTTKTVNFEASLPGTCTAPSGATPGELVFRTSDNTLHACTATNTFTQIGGGGGGLTGTFAGILGDVYDWYASNNATNMDHKITSGSYIALIHHDTNATGGFLSPSTALHTVTAGKTAIVLRTGVTPTIFADPGNRGMRLQNTTDTVTVLGTGAGGDGFLQSHQVTDAGGGADDAQLKSVAAGKTIELQTWNNTAASRGRGGFVILKEIP